MSVEGRNPPTRSRAGAVSGSLSGALATTALLGVLAGALLPPSAGRARSLPQDTTGLGAGPFARMHVLVEKSFLKIDVLSLTLRVDGGTAERLQELASGREYSSSLGDSVAREIFRATDASALVEFHRGFGYDRMLEGIRRNLRGSVDAGMIERAAYDSISRRLPRWLAFLRGRGVQEGDTLRFRLRGDTVGVVYRGAGGEPLADTRGLDPLRRISILGRYLAPGSDFREGLVRSLFRRER